MANGCSADHPRSRGVYKNNKNIVSGVAGSSPLARGLLDGVVLAVAGEGIIPARAGFTTRRPRRQRDPGIIPARAGFTPFMIATAVSAGDHPRSRGVYDAAEEPACLDVGSSPLARGLHLAILGIPTMPDPTRRLLPSLLT